MKSDNFTNLTLHRSDVDAWQPKDWWSGVIEDRVALSLVSMVGASLVLHGATRRRTNSSPWWIASGASLLGYAAVGLGAWQWLRSVRPSAESPADLVTRESVDSFPASDAPSSNATTASPQPLRSGDDAR